MKRSAGLLVYKNPNNIIEVFLVHPGGPFWKNKDKGSWSIPKGEFTDDEDPLTAAKREFFEETSQEVQGVFISLNPIKQPSGKLVFAWMVEGNIDTSKLISNQIEIIWPPKPGKLIQFPEIDKGQWFSIKEARIKILPGQNCFLDQLIQQIKY